MALFQLQKIKEFYIVCKFLLKKLFYRIFCFVYVVMPSIPNILNANVIVYFIYRKNGKNVKYKKVDLNTLFCEKEHMSIICLQLC